MGTFNTECKGLRGGLQSKRFEVLHNFWPLNDSRVPTLYKNLMAFEIRLLVFYVFSNGLIGWKSTRFLFTNIYLKEKK